MLPGQVKQKLEVIKLDAVFRHLRIDPADLGDFTIEGILNGLGPFLFLAALYQITDFRLLWILSEFFLDRLELLIEKIIALLLFNIHPHL